MKPQEIPEHWDVFVNLVNHLLRFEDLSPQMWNSLVSSIYSLPLRGDRCISAVNQINTAMELIKEADPTVAEDVLGVLIATLQASMVERNPTVVLEVPVFAKHYEPHPSVFHESGQREELPTDVKRGRFEAEVRRDWQTAYEALKGAKLEEYNGQFIAVYAGKVVGHAEDGQRLRHAMAQKHGVDPGRVILLFVDSDLTYTSGRLFPSHCLQQCLAPAMPHCVDHLLDALIRVTNSA